MEINQKKQNYLNSEIFKFVDLLEESTEKSSISESQGSLKFKDVIDLSDYLVNTPLIITETSGEKVITKKECIDLKCIGLNEKNYGTFIKFIENIYKDKNFSDLISFQFLEKITFQYILDVKKNNRANESFSNYLLTTIDVEVKEYDIFFKILHLDIGAQFTIGNVLFTYVDETFFNFSDDSEHLYNTYKGSVLVVYNVRAEKEKAKEIALKKCTLAVDCLKLCFDTIAFPNIKTSFDIDSRTTENLENEILVIQPKIENGISIDKFRVPTHQSINDDKWEIISNRGLIYFNSFFLNIENKRELSELEALICNSIQLFAYSITISNLSRRIVELFTLLESLLLPNANVPILDSLTKYLSKIITKNVNERKEIISLIKEMYAIRSSYVHHASSKNFDFEKLGKFQILIHMLIINFISLSNTHQKNQTILDEIDEAILGAY